jgi:hypothetical protein
MVNVGVHYHPLPAWRWHEASPIFEWLEGIVNHYDSVTLLRGAKGVAYGHLLLVRVAAKFKMGTSLPNVSIAVIPKLSQRKEENNSYLQDMQLGGPTNLSGNTEYVTAIKARWPKWVFCEMKRGSQRAVVSTYSFRGAIAVTTVDLSNMDAICLMIAFVRSMFAWLKCH